VKWIDPDSVEQALLQRDGYTPTRYQGAEATLDAKGKRIVLVSDSMRSAVAREQTTLVGDTVLYLDSARLVRASGDTIVLRDPSQNTSDVIALGALTYDLVHHRGVLRNFSTAVEQGQKWYIYSDVGAVQQDTTGNRQNVFYARDGSITSCDLIEPHYHFQAKEIKMISQRLIVARPAVLYISDIPVMWLPFIFQDPRRGRRSGILPPRFGLTDIVRTTSGYRRTIDNLGYYFAVNDYMDAEASVDWRSGAQPTAGDPGYIRYNGEWRYKWLDRFLSGAVRFSYDHQYDGSSNLSLNLVHDQQFSQTSRINANIAYQSNTFVQQQQAFNVAQALAAITSQAAFQQQIGFANMSIGGTRKQYSGRTEVDQDFPTFTLVPKSPVNLASWLVWSPSFSFSNSQQLHIDQNTTGFLFHYLETPGGLDSIRIDASQRNSNLDFETPIRVAGFDWRNSFRITDIEQNFPTAYALTDFDTGEPLGTRVYAKTFNTGIDWQTGVALPPFLQGTWNLSPSVSLNNVDPGPYWVRTHLSNGVYVAQAKRVALGLSSSPTVYSFFPGFGPFARIRQSLQPAVTLTYAPAASISDDYLKAQGRTRFGYLGGLPEGQLSLSLNTSFEAKLNARHDSASRSAAPAGAGAGDSTHAAPGAGVGPAAGTDLGTGGNPNDASRKLKLLSLNFSPLAYDFVRASRTGASGFTTSTFTWTATSDLIPGFNFSMNYSLFQGDPLSDTAVFKPYRTGISASLSIGRNRNPFAVLTGLFGHGVANDSAPPPGQPGMGQGMIYQQPVVAGGANSRYPLGVNSAQGWTLTLNFSSQRQRPFVGNGITFDPTAICRNAGLTGFLLDQCIQSRRQNAGIDSTLTTSAGQIPVSYPPTSTLRADMSFHFTPQWAMQWGTGFDFVTGRFSDHLVTLQRELHDWRAIFAFTRAPNGNFAFHFFINLIAEPDLKFDYDRRTYRNNTGTP